MNKAVGTLYKPQVLMNQRHSALQTCLFHSSRAVRKYYSWSRDFFDTFTMAKKLNLGAGSSGQVPEFLKWFLGH